MERREQRCNIFCQFGKMVFPFDIAIYVYIFYFRWLALVKNIGEAYSPIGLTQAMMTTDNSPLMMTNGIRGTQKVTKMQMTRIQWTMAGMMQNGIVQNGTLQNQSQDQK